MQHSQSILSDPELVAALTSHSSPSTPNWAMAVQKNTDGQTSRSKRSPPRLPTCDKNNTEAETSEHTYSMFSGDMALQPS